MMNIDLPQKMLDLVRLANEMRKALDSMDPEHIEFAMEFDLDITLETIGQLTVDLVNRSMRGGAL